MNKAEYERLTDQIKKVMDEHLTPLLGDDVAITIILRGTGAYNHIVTDDDIVDVYMLLGTAVEGIMGAAPDSNTVFN